MPRDRHLLVPMVAFLFTLSGCGSGTDSAAVSAQPPAPRTGPNASMGQARFRGECAVCHSADDGARHRIGPNLWGVYDAPVARLGDFSYSSAARRADFVWDDAKLDAYLASPQSVIPGGRMAYAGMKDPEGREDVIAYLKTRQDQ